MGVPIAVAVAVGDAVGVPVAVAVAVGVAVTEAVGAADTDVDGVAVTVGEVLAAGAEVMGEVTEGTPAVWDVQPATASSPAAASRISVSEKQPASRMA